MSYFDRQGNPITLKQWAGRFEMSIEEKQVNRTVLPNGYLVSTVWLGLDHSFGDGPPLIFESMVFTCNAKQKVTDWLELDMCQYSTEAEALKGHKRLVNKWRKRSKKGKKHVTK